ncbi:hypothetical protein CSOJ01_15027 [Colletotrichum sojae]|uniref:Zonadhesin n=1 Tax=Colletotrichum sojae TaxID=2175907 RepID=A0A8H6IP23_9PEZI|nr:hypothetical protein CSOJ01_15027 [Colletotrichum sojae]
MYQPPPADQSTFESQAQYNLQPTEDVEEEHILVGEKNQQQVYHAVEVPKRPNYRPKPLRWPFIACVIVLLSVLMALVIIARTTMPNSDSTAIIEPRHLLEYRQDNGSSAGQPPAQTTEPEPTRLETPVMLTSGGAVNTPSQVIVPSSTADLPKSEPQDPTSTSARLEPTSAAPLTTQTLPSSAPPSVKEEDRSTATGKLVITSDVPSDTTERVVSSIQTQSERVSSSLEASSAPTLEPKTSTRSTVSESIERTPTTSVTEKTSIGDTTSVRDTTSARDTTPLRETTGSATEKETISKTESRTFTTSDLDDMRINIGSTSKLSTDSAKTTVVRSTEDLSNQRKAPSVITSTISQSPNTSPLPTPTRSDEIYSISVSTYTSTFTRPGSTLTYSTNSVSNITTTSSTVIRTTMPGSTGESTFTRTITTSTPKTITRSASTSYSMSTMTIPDTTETRTSTISDDDTTYFETTTRTVGRITTSSTGVILPGEEQTTYEQVEQTVTQTSAFVLPGTVSEYTSPIVNIIPTTIATVATTAMPGQIYVEVGTTEITKTYTIPGGNRDSPSQPAMIQVVTSVIDGKVETVVDKGKPETIVTNDGGVYTVAYTPTPEMRVTRQGGQETQMVITVTPSPEIANVAVPTTIDGTPTVVVIPQTLGTAGPGAFKEVPTTVDGKATVVKVPLTPEPVLLAVQTTIDGTPTVLLVKSTPTAPGFSPISLTVVSQVGGVTGVFTTTDAPETIKTTIDGKETTIIRTPEPRVFTSVSGGTKSTMTIVTTPTGTMPLSFTVITSVGGTLSTIVSTPKPTTFTTSISGTLRTITSTPKPTTRFSTRKPSTVVMTSTSTPTSTGSPDTIITEVERFSFTGGDYFAGKFLPVILAVMIAVPLRVIDLNAKLYQPFYALAQDAGALGRNSMTLQFDGFKGFLAPFEVLGQGHPVPFITTLMIWCSSMLAPLATEAIGMKLHGTCKITAIEGCGIQLGVSTMSAHALVALLALIIVLLLVLLYFLRNFETGLHANPWSIAGISSLARNAGIRSHHLDFKAGRAAMAEKRYGFGFFQNGQGREEYGIVHHDDDSRGLHDGAAASGALPAADDELTGEHQRAPRPKLRKPVPFIALTYWWRFLFIFFLAALFTIILYYHVTLTTRTSFKDFMDSQTFGVRFFFAALGVTVIFCWESIFVSIAIISPYHRMGRRSQPPERSILLTRPTNGFYGIYAAVKDGNVVLMLAAFMSILAEFLPILFANVPYNLTQTLTSHNVCARVSLAILALMLVTVVASLFIKWPEMPVDPRSIAGAMYYLNESRMLEDFEGLSKLDSGERERKVKELGRRYFYGSIAGTHGKRMGVESVEGVEDTAYTGGHWFHVPEQRREEEHEDEHEAVDEPRKDFGEGRYEPYRRPQPLGILSLSRSTRELRRSYTQNRTTRIMRCSLGNAKRPKRLKHGIRHRKYREEYRLSMLFHRGSQDSSTINPIDPATSVKL